jgi:hypothetical protein
MNCLSKIYLLSEENERIFKLNKLISLNKSKIDFRENRFEMINDDNLNEKNYN